MKKKSSMGMAFVLMLLLGGLMVIGCPSGDPTTEYVYVDDLIVVTTKRLEVLLPGPVPDEQPLTTFSGAQYNGTVTWFKQSKQNETPLTGNFGYSAVYKAELVLTAKEDFTFQTVSANSFTHNEATSVNGRAGEGATIAITVIFTETNGKAVTLTPEESTVIEGNVNPNGTVLSGAWLTVKADDNADTSRGFKRWTVSGTDDEVEFEDIYSYITRFKMPVADITIKPEYDTAITVTCANGTLATTYAAGATATINYTNTNDDKAFVLWQSDDVTFVGKTHLEEAIFTMPATEPTITVLELYHQVKNDQGEGGRRRPFRVSGLWDNAETGNGGPFEWSDTVKSGWVVDDEGWLALSAADREMDYWYFLSDTPRPDGQHGLHEAFYNHEPNKKINHIFRNLRTGNCISINGVTRADFYAPDASVAQIKCIPYDPDHAEDFKWGITSGGGNEAEIFGKKKMAQIFDVTIYNSTKRTTGKNDISNSEVINDHLYGQNGSLTESGIWDIMGDHNNRLLKPSKSGNSGYYAINYLGNADHLGYFYPLQQGNFNHLGYPNTDEVKSDENGPWHPNNRALANENSLSKYKDKTAPCCDSGSNGSSEEENCGRHSLWNFLWDGYRQ